MFRSKHVLAAWLALLMGVAICFSMKQWNVSPKHWVVDLGRSPNAEEWFYTPPPTREITFSPVLLSIALSSLDLP